LVAIASVVRVRTYEDFGESDGQRPYLSCNFFVNPTLWKVDTQWLLPQHQDGAWNMTTLLNKILTGAVILAVVGIVSSTAASAADGAVAGKIKFNEFKIKKSADKASPRPSGKPALEIMDSSLGVKRSTTSKSLGGVTVGRPRTASKQPQIDKQNEAIDKGMEERGQKADIAMRKAGNGQSGTHAVAPDSIWFPPSKKASPGPNDQRPDTNPSLTRPKSTSAAHSTKPGSLNKVINEDEKKEAKADDDLK
jgi:hypothetical protein